MMSTATPAPTHHPAPLHGAAPHLRGWLHAGLSPLVLASGIVLVCLAPAGTARWAVIAYTTTALTLFGTSAAYHRGVWSPRTDAILQRIDHSNIYLLIAGSCTPVVVLGLPDPQRTVLLVFVWVAATLGVLFRCFWTAAPRVLYTALYGVLGWSLAPVLGTLEHHAGVAVMVLVVTGGALYTMGAVAYALRRPNPSPTWFGFHEVFHAFTVAAWAVQYIAITLLVVRAPG